MGSHQWDEKMNDTMTDWAMPVCVNLHSLTAQLSKASWSMHREFPTNRSSPRSMASCLQGHSTGSIARDGLWAGHCFWPLPVEKEAPESVAKCKRKLLFGEQAFVLLSSHMFRWDQGQRDMFQFQSCSCESLITTRTGERPWIYSHAACFRNWTPNKDTETWRVPKW